LEGDARPASSKPPARVVQVNARSNVEPLVAAHIWLLIEKLRVKLTSSLSAAKERPDPAQTRRTFNDGVSRQAHHLVDGTFR